MTAIQIFGAALAAVLIGAGLVLVLVAFVISQLETARKAKARGVQRQADFFDVLLELAKRIPLIYVPGLAMIVIGALIFLAVLASSGSPTKGA